MRNLIGIALLASLVPSERWEPKESSLIAFMANETTATSITETVYAEWISPVWQGYAGHYKNPSQFFAKWQSKNGSPTVSIPRPVSDQGTPTDHGAGVDAEYNATEATALDYIEFETTQSNFSVSEYGLCRFISDTSLEDTTAEALVSFLLQDAATILMTAANDDGCALFPSFTNQSGATGQDNSIAFMDDAIYDLSERAVLGSLVGILDNQAVRDFLNALQASSTSMAVLAGSADRQMNTSFDPNQGRNDDGYVMTYKNVALYRTGLTDTANTAADVVSAIFVRGDEEANRPAAAIGQSSKRDFRIETIRVPKSRGTEIVASMRWGCGITRDDAGQELLTDA